MKFKSIVAIAIFFIIAAVGQAVEWNGRLGIGIRGPLWAPMLKGSDYTNYTGAYEHFMMGWDGALDIKYGFTRSFVLDLTGNYIITFDDTTATADQTFKQNSSDNARMRLTGMLLGLTGQYYFLPEGNVQPYLMLGLGVDMWALKDRINDNSYKATDLGAKFGAGLNFWIGNKLSLDLQGKFTYGIANLSTDLTPGVYGPGDWSKYKERPFGGYIEPSIGFTYLFGGAKDSDKDKIEDKFDQCADTPIGAVVDQYGCPLDSDGDSVYDGIDTCPETTKGCLVDITGCPLDSDKDGVCDGLDKCVDTPESVTVDSRGCPVDTDGDGVPDYLDQEPNTPKGALVNEFGVALDGDRDGVADGIDKCPNTPVAVPVDEFGCPKAKPLTEKLVLNITYAEGSFDPDDAAKIKLDELAEGLKAYPMLKIAVNCYTDALGSERGNLKVSQSRANAVMNYLLSKGVAAERMTAKGFGEDPRFFIGDNATPAGRQKNRRIEIVPIQQ